MAGADREDDLYDIADDEPAPQALKPPPGPSPAALAAQRAAAAAAAGKGKGKAKSAKPAVAAGGGGAIDPLLAARMRQGPIAHRGQENERVAIFKKAGLAFGVVALLVAGVASVQFIGGGSASNLPDVGHDREAVELMESNGYKEARAWAEGGGRIERTLGGLNPGQSKTQIERMYEAGAKAVYAGGSMKSLSVVVEFDTDPEKRASMLEWINRWNTRYDPASGQVQDVGQRYHILPMPLVWIG